MRLRPLIGVLAALASASCAVAPAASAADSEQIAWVRRAANNFVTAELHGDGAGACAVLDGPLRASAHHRTCAQLWDARLAAALRTPGTRARLRADARAIPRAPVSVRGRVAVLHLPAPLFSGESRLVWNEMCWMVER